mgnify:CR=1 FL=1
MEMRATHLEVKQLHKDSGSRQQQRQQFVTSDARVDAA